MDRYYLKECMRRFLMYDRTETCGTNHLCVSSFDNKVRAEAQMKHMNAGNPYDPTLGREVKNG